MTKSHGYRIDGRPLPPFPVFRPHFPWIGGDLQTIRNSLYWRAPAFPAERQKRLDLPMNDGTDDVLSAILDRPEKAGALPLVILVHGLTGCATSRNIMTTAAYLVSEGFPTLRLNLRGAGPSLGLCNEHYHAGRTADLIAAISALPTSLLQNGYVLMGASLGGNAVLKLAGENTAPSGIRSVISVCAPIDLKRSQMRIMSGRNTIYHRHLLKQMKADALKTPACNPDLIHSITSVYDFDNRLVAPANGFSNAEDYYERSSAKNYLADIRVPTLVIHARTDPWIPEDIYSDREWPTGGSATLLMSNDGGHVGFHGRHAVPWHNLCAAQFIKATLTEVEN